MFVGRRAAAEQPERFGAGVPKLVPAARRNGDGVTGADLAGFAGDADPARAVREIIDLLGPDMIMLLGAGADRNARFSQALVADDGIAVRQQFADFRAVLGDEGRNGVQVCDVHEAK